MPSIELWKEKFFEINDAVERVDEDKLLDDDEKEFPHLVKKEETSKSTGRITDIEDLGRDEKSAEKIVKKKKPVCPIEPGEDECCGTGCYPCVFDLYYDRLSKYEEQLESWKLEYGSESDDDEEND
eukprot:CAMPEP_0115011980 /NCGR_PEP_ID=MMETSP0216-20121206/24415_1 /TAXON_ID=223996 /ORGANISM="Protocruzia adherens, Strain Boccale" /LENGTH=125 /DNA_ID=CAMNT_0002380851 /DNA_START=125 /DNA_END=502 /DNA_ORIENTATION=-